MPERVVLTGVQYGVIPVEELDDGKGDNAEGRVLWFADTVTKRRYEIPMFLPDAEKLIEMLKAKPSDLEIATEMPKVPPPGQRRS